MDTSEKLLAKFIQDHTSEVANKIEEMPEKDLCVLLESLSAELSAKLLGQMHRFTAGRILGRMVLEKAILLTEKLPFHIAEVLLRQTDAEVRSSIIEGLPDQLATPLKQILKYPKNSVGAYLDPWVFTLYEDNTISQGLEKFRKNDPIIYSQIYILDRNQALVGFIELKSLITNDANKLIRSLVNSSLHKVSSDMNIAELQGIWKRDDFIAQLPVVDSSGTFLGIITRESMNKKKDANKGKNDQHAEQTIAALGDLYNIGLSGLFRSTAELVGNQNLK